MSKTVADYPDAVRRIVAADVPADVTTRDGIEQALKAANTPQYTSDVIEAMRDAVVTEDRVIEAIESSGELPSEAEIDSIADVSDDYDMDDRVQSVARQVRQNVATVEDVETALESRRRDDRPTFREDVEAAVDAVESQRQFVGDTADNVTAEKAHDLGAPRENTFQRAKVQSLGGSDTVTAKELGISDRTSQLSVIRDAGGNAVGVVGGANAEDRQAVADQLGASRVFGSAREVQDSMKLNQSEGRASLTLDGQEIREVDVE